MQGDDLLACRFCAAKGGLNPPRAMDDMIPHVAVEHPNEADSEALRPDVSYSGDLRDWRARQIVHRWWKDEHPTSHP